MSGVLAIILVAGGHFHGKYVEAISEVMIEKNQQIKSLLQNEDFENAKKLTDEMRDYLDSKRITLSIIADHMMIENIEKNIAQMRSYTIDEQRFDSLSNCDVLQVLLIRMKKAFRLSIENIF